MPKAKTFILAVDDSGELLDKSWYRWLVNEFKFYASKQAEVRIGPVKRSSKQNRWMHHVFSEIAKEFVEAGITSLEIVTLNGEIIPIPVTMESIKFYYKAIYGPRDEDGEIRSTASYDTTEMTDFLEAIRQDETILRANIWIPDPDPQYKLYRQSIR